jgi:hypothetical protein
MEQEGFAQDVRLSARQVLRLCGACVDMLPGGWCRRGPIRSLRGGRYEAAVIARLVKCPLGLWEVVEGGGVRVISGCS